MKIKQHVNKKYIEGYVTTKHIRLILTINLLITFFQIEWYIFSLILNLLTYHENFKPVENIQIIFSSITLFFTGLHLLLLVIAINLGRKNNWWSNSSVAFTWKRKIVFKIKIIFSLYCVLISFSICIGLNICNIIMPERAWIWAVSLIIPTLINMITLQFFSIANNWIHKRIYKTYVSPNV